MPAEYYKEILELAVLEACEDELVRLKSQQAESEIGQSISEGLSMLKDLQSGVKPDYDYPWVPLLHASWFHLRHVNFLRTELTHRLKRHAISDEIRVMDFGCGTMPVMWAVALALAGPENGLTHHKVVVENYDTSEEMQALGGKLQTKLRENFARNKSSVEGKRLYDAIRGITEVKLDSDADLSNSNAHLLTAIYCIYDNEGRKEVENIPIADKCVILHSSKAKQLGLTIQKSVKGPWTGELKKLTNFRTEKLGCYCSDEYLRRPVTWNYSGIVLVNL